MQSPVPKYLQHDKEVNGAKHLTFVIPDVVVGANR